MKKIKKTSKIKRNAKKDDRVFEGLSNLILGENEINRTPEQQRNDMFKTMDEADKNREQYEPITFAEMGEKILKDENHPLYKGVVKGIEQSNKRMEELCDLCGKPHKEHDSRGFIYFHGDDRLKAGWSCVEEIVRKNKIKEGNKL